MVPGAGHCLVGVGKIQELVLTVKTVWRTNENGHPSASGSPWGDTCKGAERPSYCPWERAGRCRPHAGRGWMISQRMEVEYGQAA